MRAFLVIATSVLLVPAVAFAHLPRDAGKGESFIVDNPTISKAYYGELPGEPVTYSFTAKEPFLLYVGVLVPDVAGIDTDVSADIYRNGERVAVVGSPEASWERWYEEFAGDWYFDGGEYEGEGVPGTYAIIVSSPDNAGRYVLAIGKEEQFTLDESLKTFLTLPEIKERYFDKSPFSAFVAPIVLPFLLLSLLIPAALFFLVRFILRRLRRI